jgi:predicted AAA+ superfamily ATPase
VQRAPELMRSIKRVVDEDRRPGRFLLTGSADLLALPRVSESLAGRMETITLLPLSRAELGRRKPSFLARAFEGHVQPVPKTALVTGSDLVDAVLAGGYPEVLARRDPSRRRAWVRDYTRAIVARDVRDIAEIAHLDEVPRLLAALAHQAGQLINYADLAGKLGLDAKTARRYLGILEQVYLVRRIEPWSANRLKRLIKTPKLHFGDTAVLAGFRGVRADNLLADRTSWGALLETFVVSEIAKQLTWTDRQVTLHHYRDKDQLEVDLVLERDDGAVIGIEVKAAASVNERDFSGLRRLQAACGTRFMLGAVVYDGDMAAPFGPALSAVPISALWR